jgi:hypothetical protein
MRRLVALVILFAAVGCNNNIAPSSNTAPAPASTTAAKSFEQVFPATNAIQSWTTSQAVQLYTRDTIFQLVDGQADFYFAYGFQQVAVQRYQNGDGRIDAEVWQLATPGDAYGLFTSVASAAPAEIGNEGNLETGRGVFFWQDRYAIHVSARQQVDDNLLLSFAKVISQALPRGGVRPALISRLPRDGLVDRGYIFFHEELAIQDRVFLGGKNILGLSHDTEGVVAQYVLPQPVQLLLIQYPAADEATAGLKALQASTVKNLLASRSSGNLLGAVFGKIDKTQADKLLDSALPDR